MKDKRDECGCHRECSRADDILGVPPHDCAVPCRWPDCLTPSEEIELLAELAED